MQLNCIYGLTSLTELYIGNNLSDALKIDLPKCDIVTVYDD